MRRLSCRATTSASAARSASASSRPDSRNATVMLYIGDGPWNWSMNHSRVWANDSGITAGRSPATSGSGRSASLPTRSANSAAVGASKTVRTPRSVFRLALTAAISRIADRESPPRSKNESSTPTRSSPSTWP
ncbi:hypothetical protein O974_14260 [Mycobacterium avium 11-0986]|nr:hypothetical protein O974_14260 [Mycobacterium avium 11-0986]